MAELAPMHQESVRLQRGAHGGLVIRVPKFTARDLLVDWNPWKQLLSRTRVDEWLLAFIDEDTKEVIVLTDNGLGGDGPCPFHKKQHLQIYMVGSEPMRCAQAVAMMASKK